jgi:hypothetical protein
MTVYIARIVCTEGHTVLAAAAACEAKAIHAANTGIDALLSAGFMKPECWICVQTLGRASLPFRAKVEAIEGASMQAVCDRVNREQIEIREKVLRRQGAYYGAPN